MMSDAAQFRDGVSDAAGYCRVAVEAARIGAHEAARLTNAGVGPDTTDVGPLRVNAAVGRVVRTSGQAAADGIRTGDRVAVHGVQLAPAAGSDGKHDIEVLQGSLCPVPSDWPLSRALLLPVAALAARAIRACAATAQQRVAIFGGGPAALSAIAMLKSLGVRSVVAVTDDGAVHATARGLGADAASTRDDFETRLAADPTHAVDRALCFDADNATLSAALRSTAHVGAVVVAGGLTGDPVVIPDYYREIIIKETSILGAFRPAVADWAAARDTFARGGLEALEAACASPLDATTPERLRALMERGDARADRILVFSR